MLSTAACRSRNLLAITILIAFSFLTMFRVHSASAQTLNILYNFSQNLTPPGVNPYGVLVQDKSGYLYGVTNLGGANGLGMVYKMTTAGAVQDIMDFSATNGSPYGRLALDSSGNIYGALWNDTLYELSPSGSSYTLTYLHDFGIGTDGVHPLGVTLEGSTLYGITLAGGANGKGAIYSYNVGSSTYTMLYSFGASGTDGENPYSGLLYNSGDGKLYGTCFRGGANGDGTLYSIFTDGTGYDEYSFNGPGPGSTGASPAGRLVIIGSKMYGLCSYGGTNAEGDLFVFTHSSPHSYSVSALHSFSGTDGSYPYSALCVGKDHNLYGITPYGGAYGYGVAFKTIPSTGVTSTLHSFNGVDGFFDDSTTPYAWTPCGLSQGADGNFYGVSFYGGVTAIPGIQNGSGSAFKMTASGALTTLTSFNVQDVYAPYYSGLIQANDGYFYGTTYSGGAFQNGAIYRTDAAGNLSVLHHFNNSAGYYEGSDEYPSLAQGTDGYLYGGTTYGGLYGNGTLWRCSLTGQFSILHQFQYSRDGQSIFAPPYQGADGALYGASTYGGDFNSDGTVWRCTTAGQFTVLHYFGSYNTVGIRPIGVFAQDSGKKLYGISANGYTNSDTIWSIMPNGSSFSILHAFQSSTEGSYPYAMIPIPGSSPLAFYGTCYYGGSGGDGVVWKYSQSAGLTILHSFTGTGSDGKYPTALKLGPDGNLYGITEYGGGTGNGVFYELNPNTLAYSTLYSMSAPPQATNPAVLGPLCLGSDGLFYFTTTGGGIYSEGAAVSVDTGLINALDISTSVGVTYTKSGSKAVVTIKNTGHVTLLGPIQLVITGTSPSGLTVTNSNGSVPPGFPVTGDPYVTVPSLLPHNILSLKPGATVKVTVIFGGTISSFSDKVYTGRF